MRIEEDVQLARGLLVPHFSVSSSSATTSTRYDHEKYEKINLCSFTVKRDSLVFQFPVIISQRWIILVKKTIIYVRH